MPLYEYLCDSCGHRFERIRKFSDPPLRDCPLCGGTVEKQISSPAIQFKGSGFYITDYAKSGSRSESKTDSAQSASKSSDSSTSGESKSAGESKAEKSTPSESAPKPATPAAEKKTGA